MGSLHDFDAAHWGHEPLTARSPGFRRPKPFEPPKGGTPNQPRFMESLHANSGVHWDHEPRAWSADLQVGAFGARHTAPSWSSALRFMESLLSFFSARIGTMIRWGSPHPS